MTSKKETQRTWEELRGLKDELLNKIFPEIKQTKSELELFRNELFVDGANKSAKTRIVELETKINSMIVDANQKFDQLLEFHKTVFEGDTENESIKEELEKYLKESQDIFTDVDKKKDALNSFYDKVFGEVNEKGIRVGGLEKEIAKYETRYDNLFEKIESLLPGATSAGLAKVFEDKVTEYKGESNKWMWIAFVILFALSIFYAFQEPNNSKTITDSAVHLIDRLPFIIFAVWLIVFAGNRRAESKKLEESYKHKEVMARAFVGYKEQIEELEEGSSDTTLLTSHMSNLLDAIKVNSGNFLSKDGEKSLIHETVDGIICATKEVMTKTPEKQTPAK